MTAGPLQDHGLQPRLPRCSSNRTKSPSRKASLAKTKTTSDRRPRRRRAPRNLPHLPPDQTTTQYLSGRNYDPETRGPKLGFENAPNADAETLEDRAAAIAAETQQKEEEERKEEKPIDLFSLQPKKPNWDLKRDVARKMEVLNARTENAIARLVRERIEGQKRREVEKAGGGLNGNGESVGMGGVDLVEGVHVREMLEEEEKERERVQDQDFE